MKLAVIGTIEVKPGAREEVLRAVLAHRERSLRDEPGTLQFEVLVPNEDANKILLFEVYANTQAFEAHFHSGESIALAKKGGWAPHDLGHRGPFEVGRRVGRWRLTLPSSGRRKGRFAPYAPPLLSNVRAL